MANSNSYLEESSQIKINFQISVNSYDKTTR